MAIIAKKIQPAKASAIEEAKKTFAEYNDFIFADYRGMTVEQITELRGKLREQDAALKVVKNSFARIAFEELKIHDVEEYLKGPTVVAMAREDSNVVAKTLFDFTKTVPALNVKGAFVGKEIFDAAKIEAFSNVPGRKQLIAMLMSAMNGPARQLAATLKAYAEKKEADGGQPAAKASAEASAPAAEKAAPEPAAQTADAAPAEAPAAESAAPAADAGAADAAPAEKPAE